MRLLYRRRERNDSLEKQAKWLWYYGYNEGFLPLLMAPGLSILSFDNHLLIGLRGYLLDLDKQGVLVRNIVSPTLTKLAFSNERGKHRI